MKDRPIDRILGPHTSTPGSCQYIIIYISIIGVLFSLLPCSFPSTFSCFLSLFHLQFLFFLFLFLFLFPSLPFSYSSSGLSLPYPSLFSCFLLLSLSLRVIRSIVFGGVSFLLLHGASCISIVCLFPFLALFNCFPVLLNILCMCLFVARKVGRRHNDDVPHCSILKIIQIGWRPSLLGWKPSLEGWKPSQVGWKPSLLGWRPSLINGGPCYLLLGWRPLLLGSRPSLVGWRPSLF